MKTKMMMILGLVMLAQPALALDSSALLTYTSSNGPISPTFQQVYTCQMGQAGTTSETKGPQIQFPHETLKQIVWTAAIPNATVLESLMNEAVQHTLVSTEAHLLIGGSVQMYNVSVNGKSITILQQNSFHNTRYNPSTAATEIEQLMDLNCK